ncbi:MAG: beta-propeller domain-containing protein [Candidatus Diapherotrites archaeon]
MDRGLKLIALFCVLGVAGMLLLGCVEQPTAPGGNPPGNPPTNPPTNPPSNPPANPPAQNGEFSTLNKFSNYEELAAAFGSSAYRGGEYMTKDMVLAGGATPSMAPASAESAQDSGSSSNGGVGYSTTNVQVEGVDEADIVKSDGKYIYNITGSMLVITDAYPIETAKILSQTKLGGMMRVENFSPQEMFVSGDVLLIFGSKTYNYNYGYEGTITRCGGMARCIVPPYYMQSMASARIYDIKDRAAPKLEKEVEFQGSYLTSRMIGDSAYFVINSSPNYWAMAMTGDENNIIPVMAEDGAVKRVAEATEIGYIPPIPVNSFVTIASLNMKSGKLQKETVAASAENVYSSQENIYLAATEWNYCDRPYPVPLSAEIAVDYCMKRSSENTAVTKFALSEGEIKFEGCGSVPGHVLNQFSMDEYEGNFRIATTEGQVWGTGERRSSNNLYVLGADMKTVGTLEDLAPGEQIYSVRFMGKRAYMVTFKNTDPLFVIDVSEPTAPKVLGKLKIPGYSDYLHPMDETHIIGVGKEATESKYGDFAWYQGMKIAVFDVSDVEHPVEMHKVVIGDRGTDSYALNDHRAFLYDAEKELLVLPIQLAEISAEERARAEKRAQDWPLYGEPVFQGAFVWRLTLANGFEERGRITHITPEEELKRGYYYGYDYQVKRAMYIGGVLYTLSDRMLKANNLGTLAQLKDFVFEKGSEDYYYGYYPRGV